ncbi:hypothetical protein BH10BDE1_BH10BDE1_26590 [soil metagenome]
MSKKKQTANFDAAAIERDIRDRLGSLPRFFVPAREEAAILNGLWQQTLSGFLENPIPAEFKLKLASALARAPVGYDDLVTRSENLKPTEVTLETWPLAGSDCESSILFFCVSIFLQQDAENFRRQLLRMLPKSLYFHLTLLLSFNRMCLAWVEANPELALELKATPAHDTGEASIAIGEVFDAFTARVGEREARREFWTAQESRRRLDADRRKLLSLFDQAPVPLAMLEGREHRFVFTNASYINLLFGGKEVVGRTVADAIPESVAQGFTKFLDSVYETGEPYRGVEVPVMLQQKDGSQKLFVLNFVYQPVRDELGAIEGILAVITDLTDEIRGREAIENQQRWLENLLDQMPTALFLIDPKLNYVTFANRAADQLIGIPTQNTTPQDRYPTVNIFDSTGLKLRPDQLPSARASSGEEMKGEEFVLENRQGRYDLVATSQMLPAAYGHDRTAMLLLQDLTAIKEAEEQFKLLTELAPHMPFIADETGAITYFSRQWFEYTGRPPSDIGWGWKETPVHHPEDLDRVQKTWTHSVKSGEPYEIEYRIRRADGEYRWHLGRATAVRGRSGQVQKWFGTNVDIDDQKCLQADIQEAKNDAEAANEAKSAFLANMSHEIRTPLGAILGFTDLLKAAQLEGEPREYLDVIERNGQALTRVIDDILDLSKVESGQMTIELVPFSLSELVRDSVALFGDKAKAKSIALKNDSTSSPEDSIVSDPTRVRQILINLIGNAVKFTSEGEVSVSVERTAAGNNHLSIAIRVKDTGPGIPDFQRPRLFQPFVQADNSTSRKFGGTGLGLALSRRLARALGGDVRIDASTPEGSVFTFQFDAEIADQQVPSAKMTKATASGDAKVKRLENLKILVVDDSPDNRTLMSLILRREGAVVDEAADGEEAVRKALKGEFAIVLMDIQMPGMDGYAALSTLRKAEYRRPIIALTAHAMVEERRRTAAAGFSDHVTKPVDREVLIAAILNQLR